MILNLNAKYAHMHKCLSNADCVVDVGMRMITCSLVYSCLMCFVVYMNKIVCDRKMMKKLYRMDPRIPR